LPNASTVKLREDSYRMNTDRENTMLAEFRKLDPTTQEMVCGYIHYLQQRSTGHRAELTQLNFVQKET